MKLPNTKIILYAQTIFIVILLSLLLQSKTGTKNNPKPPMLNTAEFQLKAAYFDDLTPVWLSGDTIKSADSQYAARTAPQPITHPLSLTVVNETVQGVKRSAIQNESTIVDEMYKKYGERLAGYFASKDQAIISYTTADIDSDKQKEEIVESATIGANHPPHEGNLIKNNTVILTFPLNSGSIEAAKDGNGFYVTHQLYGDDGLCCAIGKRTYRVVYQNNAFTPVWEQDVTYLIPEANSEDSNGKQ